jgi:hypothetical protein
MLAAPSHGFVFLASSKSGSTAIERSFAPHAQVILKGPPRLKHTNAASFQRHIEPLLRKHGWERDGYEVVTIVREPIDWLASWWRYRSREQLKEATDRRRRRYVGDMSFEEWARRQLDAGMPGIGRFSRFVSTPDGDLGVDRIWRYEHIDDARRWMSERVGKNVKLRRANVSPPRDHDLSAELRQRLEAYYEPEYRLYESAL